MTTLKRKLILEIEWGAVIVIAVLFFCTIGLGCWYLERKINYSLSYKSMVEQTVREMVKEEALKK